jgi:hypothetical protein
MTNIICWLLGHRKEGEVRPGAYTNSSGVVGSGWVYFCSRCNTKERYPDRRNLWQRTVPVWIMKLRNLYRFRKSRRIVKMKFQKKMIKKFDARQKAWYQTRSDKSVKNAAAFRKPGSRKLRQ